jgi:hypothetical protein
VTLTVLLAVAGAAVEHHLATQLQTVVLLLQQLLLFKVMLVVKGITILLLEQVAAEVRVALVETVVNIKKPE